MRRISSAVMLDGMAVFFCNVMIDFQLIAQVTNQIVAVLFQR